MGDEIKTEPLSKALRRDGFRGDLLPNQDRYQGN